MTLPVTIEADVPDSGGWLPVTVEYGCPKLPSHRHEVLAGVQGGPTRVGQTLYQGVEGDVP